MRNASIGAAKEKGSQTTVRTIAARLGLSPATVSLALNGQRPTSYVSIATRRQVWEAAETMGYPLEKLRSRRPPIERVAVITTRRHENVYAQSLLEISRVLNERRIQALLQAHTTGPESLEAIRNLYRRQEIDAAVFVGSRHNNGVPITQDLVDGLPSVFIGELPPGSTVWQVCPDNEGGARSAGEYLWSLGHRNVSMVYPLTDTLVSGKRLQGLRSVWEEHGGSIPEEALLRVATGDEKHIRDSIAQFAADNARADNPITALFCFNDWIAGSVIKSLRHAGVRVPEDISVVGFDDDNYCVLLDPPLTSVRQPFDVFGRMAAEMLLEQAESPTIPSRVEVAACTLVVRQSTAAPASFSHPPSPSLASERGGA